MKYIPLICLLLLVTSKAFAGTFEDGVLAYNHYNFALALKLLKPLADQGIPQAQELIGDMYYHGAGVKQSQREADRWYKASSEGYQKDAEHGDANAQVKLGILYEQWNVPGLVHSYSNAMKWFSMAERQGNARAKFEIGILYLNGWGGS